MPASSYAGAVITTVNKMNNVHTLRELMLVGTESLALLLQGIASLHPFCLANKPAGALNRHYSLYAKACPR